MVKKAVAHLFNSKTYTLLIFFAMLGLATVLLADGFFGVELWEKFFDQILVESGVGGARAIAVDGAPKVAAAWKEPNSIAANPPPAVTQPNARSMDVITINERTDHE